MSFLKTNSDPTILKKLEEKVRKKKESRYTATIGGTTYNDISYSGKKAIENSRLESFTPVTEGDKKIKEAYAKEKKKSWDSAIRTHMAETEEKKPKIRSAFEEYRKQEQKADIPLKISNGKEFGNVSRDAYMAIGNNTLDNYKPINDNEKKALEDYKKHMTSLYSDAKDNKHLVISDYTPGVYSMTKSEYLRRQQSNPDMPEFGSYEYFKNREEQLRPIMDEIASDLERRDDTKKAWLNKYLNDENWLEDADEKTRNFGREEAKRLADKFKYQDAIIAEYGDINTQLKKFERDGVHYNDVGEIDTESGAKEAGYAKDRYEKILLADALSSKEMIQGFSNQLSNDKQQKYDQNEKKAYFRTVEAEKEEAYNYYEENKDNIYKNDFGGRTTGNYKIGRIGIKRNNANSASFDAGVRDLEAADVYKALSERIQKNNYETFQNNTKGQEFLATLAQYAPQALDQLTYEVIGIGVGLATGTYGIGNLVGAGGSAGYMYRQTAGASFERLLRESDLSVEDAKKLAKSEALASGTVEFGLSIATGLLWKTGNFATKGAASKVVSEFSEAATKRAVSSLMAKGISEKGAKIIIKAATTAGKVALDATGEGFEEWTQEGMSITADRYAKEGKTASPFELFLNTFDLSQYSSSDFKRMNQSFLVGTIIGFGHGGIRAATSATAKKIFGKAANAVDAKVLGEEINNSGETKIITDAVEMAKDNASPEVAKAVEIVETAIIENITPPAEAVGTVVKSVLTDEAIRESGKTSAEQLDALTQANEPITVEEVKKVTGFGEEGAKLVAELANSEGVTFSQAERAVKTAYMAGLTNVESSKVTFETDTQIDAFTAGKKDAVMQELAQKENANQKRAKSGMSSEEGYNFFDSLTEDDNRIRTAKVNGITIRIDKRFGGGYFVVTEFNNGEKITSWTKPEEFDTFEEAKNHAAMLSFDAAEYDGGLAPIDKFYGRNVSGVRLDSISVDAQPVTSINEQNMPVSSENTPTTNTDMTENVKGKDGKSHGEGKHDSTDYKEPVDSMYDIPEGSKIVNNIVVDEHSERLKRENPRAYSNIIRMAKRLGMNVRFVKNLTDENGKALEGLITSKGIFIKADAKNPSRFVATHEFGHRMKQAAPKVWAKYQEYVINKLKRESFDSERTAYDVLYEETKNAYEKDDPGSINEEIAVNYAGELFDSEEMLESFIREDKSLALKVRDWWYKVLESMGLLSEKKKAQQMWLRAYTAAAKNVKDGKVGEYSGERYSKKEIREIFKEQVIDAIHNPNKIDGNNVLVGYTTSILKQLGLNDRLMCMTKGHVRDINTPEDGIHSEYHGLTEQEIYDMLPTILEYPAIVFDSISKQNPNAVCILSEKTTKSGLPVIVAINPDGKGRYNDVRIISNFVLSTYGKNNPIGYLNELSKNSDKVLYINEFRTKKLLEVIYDKNKRTKEEFKGARLQLPAGLNNLRFNYILHKSENVVKSNVRENNGRIRLEDRINGEDLLNAIDTIKEIRNIGGRVDNYGYVTLFHATNNESARSIMDSKKMRAKKDGLFFSTKANGEIRGYGKSVLKFKIPVEMLEMNDVFHDEIHFRLPLKNKNESMEVSDYLIVPQNMQNTAENAQEGKKSIAGTRLSELVEKYGAIPKGENPARDVSVPQKTAKDKKVSHTVRTILEAKVTPDEAIPTIEKMVSDGIFSYDVYTDKKAIDDAEASIKEHGWVESLNKWLNDVNKGEVSKKITAMGWALYNNAANTAATTTSETEKKAAIETSLTVLDAMVKHQRSAAQALQATRILKKLSPETQLYGVQKSVNALQNELSDRYGDKAPNLKIDEELAEQFIEAKTPEERAAIEREIYKDIGRQMPSRFIDKWNAWRYLAMLGNLRTHGRNILGNAFFAPVVITKDLTATAIESVVYRVSGKKTVRGKAIIKGNKADRELLKAAWSDYNNVADMISNGGKYNDSAIANQYIEEGRQIFKTKPLEWARKKNSALLEAEDMWFSKPHYAYALAQYCKANNITAEQIKRGRAIEPARVYAIKEAQKATYRDTNAFSQMVSEWGRSRNDNKNAVKKAFNTTIEGTLPFRKTPANILVRGVEYSPIGLIKGLSYDLVQVSKGKMSATEAIDNISAGLTGTGLLALGVFLAAQGIIRGHGEDDKDEKEFKELMGHQAYALELPNGQSITLDWLAPEALPFFVGVNIWEATKGKDKELTMSTILQTLTGITEPMLEMSCLQGVNDLVEGMGYASSNDTSGLVAFLSSAATSYLTQGIPSLFGQAERTGEEHRMETYTEKDNFLTGGMQYTLGKASSKIPFWDYNQIPYIDAWGRKEASGTALKRGLNNFLNPAYTSKIDNSKMEDELLRLYEITGDGGVFPVRADKYFIVNEARKDLTADEYVRYATLKGEKSYKLVSDLVKGKAYKKLTDEEKVKAIKEVYDYANQKAKQAISNYKPDTWVKKADEFGANVGNYISFKTNVNSMKEDNGGKISKQEVADIILDMAQNDSETWGMYLSMYDSNNDMYAYNKGIEGETYMYFLDSLDYVDEPTKSGKYGTYTQEEAYRAVKRLKGLSRKEKEILWQSVNTSWKEKNNPFR